MPNDAATLNPLEKVSAVETSIKAGDTFSAQNVLNTVGEQQIFMDRLARTATADALPGLQITSDDSGHTHSIKTNKLTVSDAGGHLTASSNGLKNSFMAGLNHAVDQITAIPQKISEAAGSSTLGDCLKTSGTTDSCENRRMASDMKKAGAD